jgi:ribosomal protein L29
MAKKEKDFVIAEASVEELTRRLEKNTEELFKLRFRAASAPLKNPMDVRKLRRDIARFNTFITQKTAQNSAPQAAPVKKTKTGGRSK